jgi:hypothetical protein
MVRIRRAAGEKAILANLRNPNLGRFWGRQRANTPTLGEPTRAPQAGASIFGTWRLPTQNAFEGNICLTSINAPYPSVGPSLTASPNSILVTGNALVGSTTISWMAPDAQVTEIHIGGPDGKLLAMCGNRGSIQTSAWVTGGMTFPRKMSAGGKARPTQHSAASGRFGLFTYTK